MKISGEKQQCANNATGIHGKCRIILKVMNVINKP
jgi:hypothetical protein